MRAKILRLKTIIKKMPVVMMHGNCMLDGRFQLIDIKAVVSGRI